jgi:hypothetical protein
VDQAFQKLIIDAFEDPLRNALSDERVGYANEKETRVEESSPFTLDIRQCRQNKSQHPKLHSTKIYREYKIGAFSGNSKSASQLRWPFPILL